MDLKVSKEQIIAYLYGELPDEEARKVAAYLQDNPAVAAEYKSMQHLRASLKKVQDIEVTQPVIMLGANSRINSFSTIFQNRFTQRAASVAAVIIIGLLLAKFTGLNLTYRNQALTIAFNKNQIIPETGTEDPRQKLEIGSMKNDSAQQQLKAEVNKFLARENQVLTDRLATLESNVKDLNGRTQRLAVADSNQKTGIDQYEIEDLARKISGQNLELFSEVIRASQIQQEEYIKSLFSEFAIYLQSQRVEDLMTIEASLKSLKQESELKKLETDQVITRLIQTVNDKNY